MTCIREMGVMLDCSRFAVYKPEALGKYFAALSRMGYTYALLYMEDVYEMDGEPRFGYLRGRYSKAELKKLSREADRNGIELIPCIQTLAHLSGITRWADYKPMIDVDDILLANDNRTYTLVERMIRTFRDCFISRRIHVGMDEAHMLGLGKYAEKHGFQKRSDILLRHIIRVAAIADRYGFDVMMWADMFFRLENGGDYYNTEKSVDARMARFIPDNVKIVYWDYYSKDEEHYKKMLAEHQRMRRDAIFAGGAWSWNGWIPANRFSIRASEAAMKACIEGEVENVMITCWGDDGGECSLFATLPSLFAASEFSRGQFNMQKIEATFHKFFGIDFQDFLTLEDMDAKGETCSNLSKYMLYSDPFLGVFDKTVNEETAQQFPAAMEKLRKNVENERFGYIFRTALKLCSVLELKYTLGVRTRTAYQNKNNEELLRLIADYDELDKRIDEFYDAFVDQWDRECKLNGFEHHDARIGGLKQRLRHCRKILSEYVEKKIPSIPALEEEILPFDDYEEGKAICFNDWANTAFIKARW